MSLNQTIQTAIQYSIDNTIGCEVEPNTMILRALALLGLISISLTIFRGLILGLSKPIAYLLGTINFFWNKIKSRKIK